MHGQIIGVVDPLSVPSQGAFPRPDGSTEWCLWAPHHEQVSLVLWEHTEKSTHVMRRDSEGYFRWSGPGTHGQHYAYRIGNDAREYPDPVSRWQPKGVHRASAVFDPARFAWSDAGWRGVALETLSIYELHVGTFTPEGTFAAVADRFAELRELGITAIELMPIAQFSGARNWGYDGVHPFAAQNTYGGPKGLQQLVDAAHRVGIGVILDVVYNHLGPEGNYFGTFAPCFTDRYHTPWGAALNYDGADSDPVRKLVLDNAAMWIRDFHLDGLRLDAVQTIYDTSALHILAELQQTVQNIAHEQNRRVIVIGETNQNDVRLVTPIDEGGYGLDGIWADDFHHCIHTLLTGERDGYYHDYGEPTQLAKTLRDVFVYDGRHSAFHRRRHGNRVGNTPRGKVCLLRAESRSDWESRAGGSAGQQLIARTVAAGRVATAVESGNANAFHGRRVWRDTAISFLLFLFGSRAGRGRAAGTTRGACLGQIPLAARAPRSARRIDIRGRQVVVDMGRRCAACWSARAQSGLAVARQAWFTASRRAVTSAEILGADTDAPCLWFERGADADAIVIIAKLVGADS